MHLNLPTNLYIQLIGENVVLPVDPGEMPPYIQNTTNHAVLLQWQRRKGIYNYNQMVNVYKALMAVAKAHLNQETQNAMQTLFVGNICTTRSSSTNGLITSAAAMATLPHHMCTLPTSKGCKRHGTL
jgi:glycosylphosphatidylinositol transamidase (GPIT) subunit GPI8